MEKRATDRPVAVPSDHQSTIIAQPGRRAFHFPTSFVSTQLPSIVSRPPLLVLPIRGDQLDPTTAQTLPQRITIVHLVRNDPTRLRSWPATPLAGHLYIRKRRLQQRHFRRRGRVQVDAQRNSLAIDHHHPLRALAPLGLSDATPPFFAGAKLPSAKHSDQSSWSWLSDSPRKHRQAFSQRPCSSHCFRRRQHVLPEEYSLGTSFHGAPVHNTHRMSSKTTRFGIGLRPPLGDRFGSGNNGSIRFHCSSVSNLFLAMTIAPLFHGQDDHKYVRGASLCFKRL